MTPQSLLPCRQSTYAHIVLSGEVQIVVFLGRSRAKKALNRVAALPSAIPAARVLNIDALGAEDFLDVYAVAPWSVWDCHANAVADDEDIRLVSSARGQRRVAALAVRLSSNRRRGNRSNERK